MALDSASAKSPSTSAGTRAVSDVSRVGPRPVGPFVQRHRSHLERQPLLASGRRTRTARTGWSTSCCRGGRARERAEADMRATSTRPRRSVRPVQELAHPVGQARSGRRGRWRAGRRSSDPPPELSVVGARLGFGRARGSLRAARCGPGGRAAADADDGDDHDQRADHSHFGDKVAAAASPRTIVTMIIVRSRRRSAVSNSGGRCDRQHLHGAQPLPLLQFTAAGDERATRPRSCWRTTSP